MQIDLTRRLAAEALGTLILVMAVIGSGIMAGNLAGGNQAVALLCSTITTVRCCSSSSPSSLFRRAFQSAVGLVMLYRGELDLRTTAAYVVVQIVGAVSVPYSRI
jgi:glycerol uptake facilitator-like aquaporin